MDLAAPPAADSLTLALERELEAGEHVLWSGKRLARLNLAGFGIWLFALPWTAFAVFWMAMALMGVRASGAAAPFDWAFPLFGLPFVLVGLAMMAAPFASLLAPNSVLFAITDRRVLRVAMFGNRLWTRWVEGERIGEITRTERRDGSGALQMALGLAVDNRGTLRSRSFAVGDVEDVMAASRALNDLVARRRASS